MAIQGLAWWRTPLTIGAFAGGVWVGLWLPDIDLALLPVLHHRSIITHSILVPWLLNWFFRGRFSDRAIAGLYAGLAIHLSADLLSSPNGFGMIWLPWPVKVPLGELSILWLAGNAIAAAYMGLRAFPQYRGSIFILLLAVGLAYALLNEFAFLPFVVFGVILSAVYWRQRKAEKG